jgi:hypothetical protein
MDFEALEQAKTSKSKFAVPLDFQKKSGPGRFTQRRFMVRLSLEGNC